MESFLPLVQNNLDSTLWFRPELALTFGALALFVLDLFWKKSAARVAWLTAAALAVLGVAAFLLAQQLPEYSAIMGLAFFASLGLPGLAGFISEFMVFSGSFPVFTTSTIISATSVIITAAYYLWAIHRMFLGKLNPTYKGYPDLNWRERFALYPLGAFAIVLGFYPQFILGPINTTLHALIQNIRPL